MRNEISGVIMAVVGFAGLSGPAQAQDAALGENLFRRCVSCHEVGEDARNKSGPALTGVVGRIVASVEDYRYSRGLSAANDAGLIWNEDNLVAWLENPTGYLRDVLDDPRARSKMPLKLRNEADRHNVVAYLATFSPVATATDSAGVCVTNGSETEHLFAAETGDGTRETRMLAPGATLCTTGEGDGVVSVFEQPDHLEGCSRLTATGQTEILLRYSEFDRCAWGSNSG